MKISENALKWLMRIYPPFLFQRIWVRKVHRGFSGVDVKINRSLFTTNLGNSIFGGTIFSAADPFYALLFGQMARHKGLRVTVWLKSAEIQYLKPGKTDLHYSILITPGMANEAMTILQQEGKYVKAFPIEIFDRSGTLCAVVSNEIYMRNLDFQFPGKQ